MYCDEGSVFVEKEDQCMSCENFKKGVECPLLQALGFGAAILDPIINFNVYGFYQESKRHLKLVDNNNPEKIDND